MALPSSRVTPVKTCPVLRPRWCPSHSPKRVWDCCLPVSGYRRLSPPYHPEGYPAVHHYTHFGGSITRPASSLPPAPYSHCWACTWSSLLTCWLGVSQVGLALAVRTHWVTTTHFMGFLPIPRFRTYLGATTVLFDSVATFRSHTRCYSLQGDSYGVGPALHSYSAGVRREAIQRANDCELSPLCRPASRPSTPICSSRSGHSIAYPSPSNCQCCRSAGDPCTRRGYHASGTTRLRPSARSTVNLSSVTFTYTATGSVSSTKVVMPRPRRVTWCCTTRRVMR